MLPHQVTDRQEDRSLSRENSLPLSLSADGLTLDQLKQVLDVLNMPIGKRFLDRLTDVFDSVNAGNLQPTAGLGSLLEEEDEAAQALGEDDVLLAKYLQIDIAGAYTILELEQELVLSCDIHDWSNGAAVGIKYRGSRYDVVVDFSNCDDVVADTQEKWWAVDRLTRLLARSRLPENFTGVPDDDGIAVFVGSQVTVYVAHNLSQELGALSPAGQPYLAPTGLVFRTWDREPIVKALAGLKPTNAKAEDLADYVDSLLAVVAEDCVAVPETAFAADVIDDAGLEVTWKYTGTVGTYPQEPDAEEDTSFNKHRGDGWTITTSKLQSDLFGEVSVVVRPYTTRDRITGSLEVVPSVRLSWDTPASNPASKIALNRTASLIEKVTDKAIAPKTLLTPCRGEEQSTVKPIQGGPEGVYLQRQRVYMRQAG